MRIDQEVLPGLAKHRLQSLQQAPFLVLLQRTMTPAPMAVC